MSNGSTLSAHIAGPTMFVNLIPAYKSEIWHTSTIALCLQTGVKKLATFLYWFYIRKLVFLESLLFHYIMTDIGYNEKNWISLYYNGLISILLPWKYYQVNNYPLKRIYL